MPTYSSESSGSVDESHQAREFAESFGTEAERYERTRPSYPDALVDAILAVSKGRDALDVGIGTGISARPFRAHGYRVLGLDPDERMAERARADGFDVEIGKFEDWEPSGRTFDLLIAGQTWHWVEPLVGAEKAAACLSPGARVALFWNVMAFPPHIAAATSEVYRAIVPEFPFFQNGDPGGISSYAPILDNAEGGLRASGAFTEIEQWRFEWSRRFTSEEWIDVVPTFGGHSRIPKTQLTKLLSELRRVVDSSGGDFKMGYTAVVVTTTRQTA